MFEWLQKSAISILEQNCQKYLPTAWYQRIGHYLWPEMFIKKVPTFCSRLGFNTLEEACNWAMELDPKVAFAATAGVAIIAGGVYYWLTHRRGTIVAHPMLPELTKDNTQAFAKAKKAEKKVQKEPQPIATAKHEELTEKEENPVPTTTASYEPIHALATLMVQHPVTKTEPITEKEDKATPQAQFFGPRMMPVDTICRTYLNTYRNDPTTNFHRIHYNAHKHDAQQFVLQKMKLHLDGTAPTDVAEIVHYNAELDKLGLITHKL